MNLWTKIGSRGFGRWSFLFVAATAIVGASGSPALAQQSANLYAVVDQDGNLVSGNRVLTVDHAVGSGQYEVTFAADVSNCAYIATTANAFTQALQVFTAGGHISRQGVFLETKNQGGGLMDGPFHLVVACNTPGISYAVVGYRGELVRSSPGTTLVAVGFGQYEVNFAASVAACASVATVGDPANALVFAPSGVYTGSRPSPLTVYVETKNPGGGLQPGIPFHLAVVCPQAPGTRIAVVRADGLPQRASPLTSSINTDPGHYLVATGRDISDCATVATRGSVDTSVPFNPTTVEILPGLSVNSIGFEERALLFFGGDLVNEAFHTAIVCGTTL
jgi:hypothetical protein